MDPAAVGGFIRSYILCGGVLLYEETRIESSRGSRLAGPAIVAPDYASVVGFEVELKDVSDVGGGVCWVKERCFAGGLDDYYFGGGEVWTCQGDNDE